jgi:leader peptidase (prepilin peptidase)/N-methyltransferase
MNLIIVIKGFIFTLLLIVAAYCDAKTQEIPNFIPILILLDGLIFIQPIPAAIGFFAVSFPLLLIAKITGGGVGGGDIKLMAACGFFLGPEGAVIGTIIGMVSFLIVYLIFYGKKKKMYAMAPYFGIGCFFAYLLIS